MFQLRLSLVPLALLALAGRTPAQIELRAETLVSGLDYPTELVGSPLEPDVLFLVQQDGVVRRLDHGVLDPVPFIDLSAKVALGALGGMTEMVFHPDYASTGWVYLTAAASGVEASILRYTVPVPASYAVDLTSELELIKVTDVIPFHHGGGMDFALDGKLLVSFGDRRLELAGGGCTAQDGSLLLGKVLRLNDDGSTPADNPYVGVPGIRDEIFAWGLRQPIRLSVDKATGDVWIAEVGESSREEIVRIPAGSGGGENFGWRIMEGDLCTPSTECTGACPSPLLLPSVYELDHTQACAVMGGHVYRGTAIPELVGRYVFADWCFARVWSFKLVGGVATDVQEHTADLNQPGITPLAHITAIAEDTAGELYVVDSGGLGAVPGKGVIMRILPGPTLLGDVDQLSLASGGVQTLSLKPAAAHAGELFLMLGSLHGTNPGTPAGGGWTLPLNFDNYMAATLGNPNQAPLTNSLGTLDASAKATTLVTLPTNLSPAVIGLQVNHAFVLLDPSLAVTFASNAVSVDLVP